jgi:hypothetical protein
MTNWQDSIQQSVASLTTRKSADFGCAYVERLNYENYQVQSYAPLEELRFDFAGAIQRLIEIAEQNTPRTCHT